MWTDRIPIAATEAKPHASSLAVTLQAPARISRNCAQIDSSVNAAREVTLHTSLRAVTRQAVVKNSKELHVDRQHPERRHRGHAACLVVGGHTAGRGEDQHNRRHRGHAAYLVVGGHTVGRGEIQPGIARRSTAFRSPPHSLSVSVSVSVSCLCRGPAACRR